jgi:hypothetical protein
MGFSLQPTKKQTRVLYLGSAVGSLVGAMTGFFIAGQLIPAVFGLFLGALCGGGIGFFLAGPDRESQSTIDSINYVQGAMIGRIQSTAFGAFIGLILGLIVTGISLLLSNEPPIAVWLISAGAIGAAVGVIVGRS